MQLDAQLHPRRLRLCPLGAPANPGKSGQLFKRADGLVVLDGQVAKDAIFLAVAWNQAQTLCQGFTRVARRAPVAANVYRAGVRCLLTAQRVDQFRASIPRQAGQPQYR